MKLQSKLLLSEKCNEESLFCQFSSKDVEKISGRREGSESRRLRKSPFEQKLRDINSAESSFEVSEGVFIATKCVRHKKRASYWKPALRFGHKMHLSCVDQQIFQQQPQQKNNSSLLWIKETLHSLNSFTKRHRVGALFFLSCLFLGYKNK